MIIWGCKQAGTWLLRLLCDDLCITGICTTVLIFQRKGCSWTPIHLSALVIEKSPECLKQWIVCVLAFVLHPRGHSELQRLESGRKSCIMGNTLSSVQQLSASNIWAIFAYNSMILFPATLTMSDVLFLTFVFCFGRKWRTGFYFTEGSVFFFLIILRAQEEGL